MTDLPFEFTKERSVQFAMFELMETMKDLDARINSPGRLFDDFESEEGKHVDSALDIRLALQELRGRVSATIKFVEENSYTPISATAA